MSKTNQETTVFRGIATFYITKHAGSYGHAIDEIERVGFRHMEIFGECVAFWVKKPGLFIGRRGENVTALEKILSKKVYIREVEGETEDLIINAVCDERDMTTANWEFDSRELEYEPPYLATIGEPFPDEEIERLNNDYYPPNMYGNF